MGTYSAANQAAGFHQPGIQSYPSLFDLNGAPVDDGEPTAPRLVATLPASDLDAMGNLVVPLPPLFQLSVGGTPVNLNPTDGVARGPGDPSATGFTEDKTLAVKSTLMMNLEDPRAQLVDQSWSVTFEGAIPGFGGSLAGLTLDGTGPHNQGAKDAIKDGASRFCDGGVHSRKAILEKLTATNEADKADQLADYVHLTTELPDEASHYWDVAKAACDINSCRLAFGTFDVPAQGRDFRIVEATQDSLEIEPRASFTPADSWREVTRCCFPGLVNFDVRVGDQWAVTGDQTGFMHHVIADPATGVCRDSCDPELARKNGRAVRTPNPLPAPDPANPKAAQDPSLDIRDGGKFAFINPMFRFYVKDPPKLDPTKEAKLQPGEQFRFTSTGAFAPLEVKLSPDGTTLIQPVGMAFVSPTGQLAVTDGSINGLLLIDLSSSKVGRSFL
jgi:hypothetical protein